MPIDIAKISSPTNAGFGASAVTTFLNSPDKEIGIRPYVMIGNFKQKGSSFLFDVMEEEELNIEADITDYYLEDNSPVQDHIAFKPITIKLHGFIAEVADTPPALLKALASIVDKLQVLGPWAPSLTSQAQQAYNNISRTYQGYAKLLNATGSTLKGLIGGDKPITKQANAFNTLSFIQKRKQLCDVQTPFQTYSNMVIQTITALQGKESKSISDFTVTMKQMNFAKVLNVADTYAKRLGHKAAPLDDKGATKGKPTSVFYSMAGLGK
jgi:hypothetical protein